MTAAVVDRAAEPAHVDQVDSSVPARAPRWPWFLGLAATLQYLLVGVWLVGTKEWLIPDGVERTTNAMAIVLSRDPHLGAMGLYWMPLPMLIRIPILVLLRPFQAGIYAGPIASAVAAGLVIPVLAKIGAALRVSTSVTVVVTLLYAFNPVTIWHAGNGMSESWFALCIALVLLSYVQLVRDGAWHPERMPLFGIALGLGMASRFEFIPICVAGALAIVVQAPRSERRASVINALVPPAFVFFFWSLASMLFSGDAFYWYEQNKQLGATPDFHPWMPDQLTPLTITGYVLAFSMIFAPALGGAIGVACFQRRTYRRWLGLLVLLAAYPGVNWFQLMGRTGVGAMRYFGITPLLGAVATMWVIGFGRHWSTSARSWMTAGLLAATATGWGVVTYHMSFERQTWIEREAAFFAPLIGKQPVTVDENLRGLADMAGILDPHLTAGRLVAMEAKGGWLTLYTSHPERFLIPYDRDWEEIMSDPDGRFDFVFKQTVLPPSSQATADAAQLDGAMSAFTEGEFVMVAKNEAGELWEFVPIGGTPTVTGARIETSEPESTSEPTTTVEAATTSTVGG